MQEGYSSPICTLKYGKAGLGIISENVITDVPFFEEILDAEEIEFLTFTCLINMHCGFDWNLQLHQKPMN